MAGDPGQQHRRLVAAQGRDQGAWELNDHQLRDIGLMRCDIEGAAKRFTYPDIGPLP
jgi:hypothetical protein